MAEIADDAWRGRWYDAVVADPVSSSEDNDDAAPGRSKRWRTTAAIALATLLFLLCTSLLFYRFLTVHEPSSGIRVIGSPALENAIVTAQAKHSQQVVEGRLTASLHYHAHFFLDPGSYEISVTTAEGDVVHFESVELYAGHPTVVDLTRLRPQTQPS